MLLANPLYGYLDLMYKIVLTIKSSNEMHSWDKST